MDTWRPAHAQHVTAATRRHTPSDDKGGAGRRSAPASRPWH